MSTGEPAARASGLVVEDLAFTYQGAAGPTLTGVDFEVDPGRSAGLLGPNGAGKSSLLGSLVGALAGERTGRVAAGGSTSPMAVALASQDIALHPSLTVLENLRHFAGITLAQRHTGPAIDDAMHEFALGAIARRPVHDLSGGQQRIAHLGCSFVHQPPVRLLDEPTTGLDFETRAHLIELVEAWRNAGVAVLVTSHYPEDIEQLCTDLLLLADGTVRSLGPLVAVLDRGPGARVSCWQQGERCVVDVPFDGTANGLERMSSHPDLASAERIDSVSTGAVGLRDLLLADPGLRGFAEAVQGA